MVLREAMGFFYFGKRGVDRRIRKMIHICKNECSAQKGMQVLIAERGRRLSGRRM